MVDLKSLTYTSLAKLDLSAGELDAIHRTARDLNALDGITGLLIFNGTRFLQIIEGAESAVDDLLERLRRDRRHSALEVRDQRRIEQRSFPDWSMELVRVSTNHTEAKETIAARIPDSVSDEVRDRLLRMTEGVSGSVQL
jgi:hypothetical protein